MTKISALTALAGASVDTATDLLPIVDMSEAGAARNKKITVAELKIALGVPTAYTDEQVRDVIAAALVAGTNITVTNNDGADTITIDAASGGGGGLDAEAVMDVVAGMMTAGSNITLTYDDAGNTLTIAASGGGSGAPWYLANAPTVASVTSVSGDATSPTLTNDSDVGLLIHGGAPVTGDKIRGAERAIASPGANWTWTVRIEGALPSVNYGGLMIWCRDSAGGKVVTFGYDQTGSFNVTRVSSIGGVFSATPISVTPRGRPPVWFRITFDAATSTLSFYVSPDGKVWSLVGTETVAAYLAANPTRVGFGVQYNRTTGMPTVASVGYAVLA